MALRGDVERYKKGKTIQQSLYGCVRFGKDLVLQKWVVIKEFQKILYERRITRDGVRSQDDPISEMEIHKFLTDIVPSSPYIIKLEDIVDDTDYLYFILEWAGNESDLFTVVTNFMIRLQNPGLPLISRDKALLQWQNTTRYRARQIAEAIKFMHDHDICHGDLSLENVMLDENLNVKIIDFGLAKRYTTQGVRGNDGKHYYMSFEKFRAQRYDLKANDIWCFGVMLWMMLIGSPPYDQPIKSDAKFEHIVGGIKKMKILLDRWDRTKYMNESALDLLNKIFKPQKVLNQVQRLIVEEDCRNRSRLRKLKRIRDPTVADEQEKRVLIKRRTETLEMLSKIPGRYTIDEVMHHPFMLKVPNPLKAIIE